MNGYDIIMELFLCRFCLLVVFGINLLQFTQGVLHDVDVDLLCSDSVNPTCTKPDITENGETLQVGIYSNCGKCILTMLTANATKPNRYHLKLDSFLYWFGKFYIIYDGVGTVLTNNP